jgi:uncharacterized protein (TIGR02611 family)
MCAWSPSTVIVAGQKVPAPEGRSALRAFRRGHHRSGAQRPKPRRTVSPVRTLSRAAGAVATSILGAVLVAAGIVMLVTPGPGLLTIAAGLALLARTFPWARHLLDRGRRIIHARLDRRSTQKIEHLDPARTRDTQPPLADHDVA